MAWSLAGFSAGVLVAAALPAWTFGILAGGLAIAAWHAGRARPRPPVSRRAGERSSDPWPRSIHRRTGSRRACLLAALALASGFAWFHLQAGLQAARSWPAERAQELVELVGRVEALPESRGDVIRFPLRVDDGAAGLRRVELAWYRPGGWPRPGETWHIQARLDPPGGPLNPGGYDRRQALFAQRIDALGRVDQATRLAAAGPGSLPDRLRQDASDWLQAVIPDLRSAALIRALTVGDRSGITADLSEQLRSTGTAHLLAISGLHVSLVAGVAALLAGVLFTPRWARWFWPDRRRYALAGGLLAALVYGLLSGFSLPTQRALLMLCIGLGAILLRRPLVPGHALLCALAAVLALDPLAPLSLGFWLSFAAVAVLIWAFAGRSGSAGRGLLGLIRAQLVLGLGLLPLNLGLFQQWVPAALPANLVVIPLIGALVLPLGLLSVGAYGVGVPADALARLAGRAMEAALAVIDRAGAALPAGTIDWLPGALAISLGFVGALWLLAPRRWPARALGAFLLLPLLVARPAAMPEGGFGVVVLDVGDGLAVAVHTRTSTLLFGVGPGEEGGRDGQGGWSRVRGTLVPALRSLGAGPVHRVVVPGASRGLAGGLADARRQWPSARFIGRHPEVAERCVAGRSWSVDGVQFRWIHPSAALPDLGGDDDCVLLVASSAGRVLLTGRQRKAGVARLRGRTGPLDAVLVPSQGHRDAADPAWWHEIGPQVALASLEPTDRYGRPHAGLTGVLARRGIPLLTTADCGAIRIAFRPGRPMTLEVERDRRRRAWQRTAACPRPSARRASPAGLGYDAASTQGVGTRARPPTGRWNGRAGPPGAVPSRESSRRSTTRSSLR
ncbi:DNA internalization-related competence protein ComEC/Rec2 [Halomonas denitrificans]|nr:DNA internalization-related competence protein ComEC/Rec2 [Halomonas denitrificans]